MSPEVEPNVDPVIWAAIEQKRLIRFRYKNRDRIVEPHDYGIHKGVTKLFAYQVGRPGGPDAGRDHGCHQMASAHRAGLRQHPG